MAIQATGAVESIGENGITKIVEEIQAQANLLMFREVNSTIAQLDTRVDEIDARITQLIYRHEGRDEKTNLIVTQLTEKKKEFRQRKKKLRQHRKTLRQHTKNLEQTSTVTISMPKNASDFCAVLSMLYKTESLSYRYLFQSFLKDYSYDEIISFTRDFNHQENEKNKTDAFIEVLERLRKNQMSILLTDICRSTTRIPPKSLIEETKPKLAAFFQKILHEDKEILNHPQELRALLNDIITQTKEQLSKTELKNLEFIIRIINDINIKLEDGILQRKKINSDTNSIDSFRRQMEFPSTIISHQSRISSPLDHLTNYDKVNVRSTFITCPKDWEDCKNIDQLNQLYLARREANNAEANYREASTTQIPPNKQLTLKLNKIQAALKYRKTLYEIRGAKSKKSWWPRSTSSDTKLFATEQMLTYIKNLQGRLNQNDSSPTKTNVTLQSLALLNFHAAKEGKLGDIFEEIITLDNLLNQSSNAHGPSAKTLDACSGPPLPLSIAFTNICRSVDFTPDGGLGTKTRNALTQFSKRVLNENKEIINNDPEKLTELFDAIIAETEKQLSPDERNNLEPIIRLINDVKNQAKNIVLQNKETSIHSSQHTEKSLNEISKEKPPTIQEWGVNRASSLDDLKKDIIRILFPTTDEHQPSTPLSSIIDASSNTQHTIRKQITECNSTNALLSTIGQLNNQTTPTLYQARFDQCITMIKDFDPALAAATTKTETSHP